MTIQESEETLPGEELDAQAVANAFVNQYYMILHKSPELLHRFYKDQSVLDWPELDGSMTSVTTMQGINDKIMSSDYKGCFVEIINAYAQDSLMEGVIVAVTGWFIAKDKERKIFCQTFFLAKQEKGYFVSNDIFQFVDAQESLNSPVAGDCNENATNAPLSSDPEPADVPAQAKPEKMSSCTEAVDNPENLSKVTEAAAEVPDLSISPSQNVKHDSLKISYASVVAKESKIESPTNNSGHRIIRVAATANQQSAASSPPVSNSLTKGQTSSVKSLTENNNSSNKSGNDTVHAEAVLSKTVYIQNLPTDITKNELVDAVKKFGQVRLGSVQLRTFEDGFCFGFVEFESPSSAESAVEAHNITVRGYEARISYKKSGNRAGNGTRTSGGFRSENFTGQENGEFLAGGGYRDDNRADFVGWAHGFNRQNGEFTRRNSQSRDGRAHSREAYPRNSWRNEEKWSDGEAHQRYGQWRNERGNS
ncbi:hypothetical protein ACH5RR_030438 [Cinchona calisaya]|uniref:Uncharacterized protein n=1 Tax=Cinchona calisaya TaxID=153742 RepID=A0ABD2YYW2_9GENT